MGSIQAGLSSLRKFAKRTEHRTVLSGAYALTRIKAEKPTDPKTELTLIFYFVLPNYTNKHLLPIKSYGGIKGDVVYAFSWLSLGGRIVQSVTFLKEIP